MTPLASTPVQTGAAGSQQDAAANPTKVGAFEVPKATSSGQAAAGQSPAKPQTDHVVVNVGTGETRPASKPIEIPKDVQWQKPVTAVRGDIPKSGTVKAVVTFVPDGDTVFGKQSDGSALACRIDGIDAPEVNSKRTGKPGQPYGEESKKTLQDMILNKEVTVRITKPSVNGSNYGRDMCQIEIEGKDVSTEMVKAGAAWLYPHFNDDPRLKAVQDEAIASQKGLWAGDNPIPPWQFRQMQKYGK